MDFFLAQAMLWGAAAAAVPVILHLTGRARPVPHKFAALRFIVSSHRSATRALRVKNLLLLVLRILAILFLVLALARPLIPIAAPSVATAAGKIKGDFVLVLDATMSMSFKEGSKSRFEVAQQEALELVDRLTPDSRVALILAHTEPDALQGRLTLNHDLVRKYLQRARVTGLSMDLDHVLTTAQDFFDRDTSRDLQQSIVLFTDLQKLGFEQRSVKGTSLRPVGTGKLAELTIIDVAANIDAPNGAVLSVRIPGATLAAQKMARLTAHIRPVDANRVCPVDLFIDGVKVGQQAVDPLGEKSLEVEFSFPVGPPGPHHGKMVLTQNDGLQADQEWSFSYTAGQTPQALILEKPSDPLRKGSGLYLRAILGSSAAASISGLTLMVEPKGPLTKEKLREVQLVILADPGDLDEASWSALKEFVEQGGGLFIWCGPNTDPVKLRPHGYSDFARHRGLLPGVIKKWTVEPEQKPLGIRLEQTRHPLLSHLTPELRSVLRKVRVWQHLKIEMESKDVDSTVVLKCTDGSPLLLEKPYGRGHVVLCAMGPDPISSDLSRHHGEVLLTLVLDACRLLTGHEEQIVAHLGKPLTLEIPDPPTDRIVKWRKPGAANEAMLLLEKFRHREESGQEDDANEAPLLVARLFTTPIELSGIHRFSWEITGQDLRCIRYIAANPETIESDLSRIDRGDVSKSLKPWKAVVGTDVGDIRQAGETARAVREFPPVYLLLVVIALLVAESFLSNRLYRPAAPSKS